MRRLALVVVRPAAGRLRAPPAPRRPAGDDRRRSAAGRSPWPRSAWRAGRPGCQISCRAWSLGRSRSRAAAARVRPGCRPWPWRPSPRVSALGVAPGLVHDLADLVVGRRPVSRLELARAVRSASSRACLASSRAAWMRLLALLQALPASASRRTCPARTAAAGRRRSSRAQIDRPGQNRLSLALGSRLASWPPSSAWAAESPAARAVHRGSGRRIGHRCDTP